jgi:hypothetical protein
MSRRVASPRSLALVAVLAACSAACDEKGKPRGPMGPSEPERACEQDDVAFVREATLALLGRRTLSEQEAQSAAELIAQVDALDTRQAGAGRRVWARALMDTPEFITRWQDQLLDALQVPRTDTQALSSCYGVATRGSDDAALATFVRDHTAMESGVLAFTFHDLMRSSLVLDDLSPIYRAHMFAMLTRPNFCGNVDPVVQELTVRQEVGHVFDAAYTNRDQVCLGCHNSEESVTYRPRPEDNRHFAIAAKLEKAVFGKSEGVEEKVPHAVFRTAGFLSAGMGTLIDCGDMVYAYCDFENSPICDNGVEPECEDGSAPVCTEDFLLVCETDTPTEVSPWGADPGCGTFNPNVEDDPADVSAQLATVRGKRATVFELELVLKRGVDALARHGLVVDNDGEVKDPEAAFAYLVALNIVDRVWREVIGSPLTISTRFPRTQAAHDLLKSLTNHFVAEHFSLKTLLLDILETRQFNALAPSEGCGEPYAFDPVFDPWVRDEPEELHRRNSAADGVHPLSPRTLMSATYAAIGWPAPEGSRFPGAMDPGFPIDDGEEPMDDGEDFSEDGEDFVEEDGADEDAFDAGVGDAGKADGAVGGDGDSGTDGGSGNGSCAGLTCQQTWDKCALENACCDQTETACAECYELRSCEQAQQVCNDESNCCDFVEWLCDPCLQIGTCQQAQDACDNEMMCCEFVDFLCGGDGGASADEIGFQRSIGVFLSISQKGFRGLDLSARLTWEERFGSCAKPAGAGNDAIDALMQRALAQKALLQDAVLALKDRLIGEPRIDPGEAQLLRDLLGATLGSTVTPEHESGLRALCGALLSSPEHLLGGLPPRGGELPRLGPSRQEACQALSALPLAGYRASCDEGALRVMRSEGKK